jgi:hypothetical protein
MLGAPSCRVVRRSFSILFGSRHVFMTWCRLKWRTQFHPRLVISNWETNGLGSAIVRNTHGKHTQDRNIQLIDQATISICLPIFGTVAGRRCPGNRCRGQEGLSCRVAGIGTAEVRRSMICLAVRSADFSNKCLRSLKDLKGTDPATFNPKFVARKALNIRI